MLEFLETNLEHFSPARVVVDTPEKVSSRVERFFGAYKNLTRHEVLPLVDAVARIRILVHMALIRRSRFWVPSLPLEILSERDQNKLGIVAARILLVESRKLTEERVEVPTDPFPDCCEVA
jgi:hypothetical protein